MSPKVLDAIVDVAILLQPAAVACAAWLTGEMPGRTAIATGMVNTIAAVIALRRASPAARRAKLELSK